MTEKGVTAPSAAPRGFSSNPVACAATNSREKRRTYSDQHAHPALLRCTPATTFTPDRARPARPRMVVNSMKAALVNERICGRKKENAPGVGAFLSGGDGRIRTVDARFCAHAPLAGECLQPLGHVSKSCANAGRARANRSVVPIYRSRKFNRCSRFARPCGALQDHLQRA
jgi:hypothetical protein